VKKVIILLVGLLFIAGITFYSFQGESEAQAKGALENKLIRFHVIANSDSMEDQAIKLKVKEEILRYIGPKLQESGDLNTSRKILRNNDKAMTEIACRVLKENKYNYGAVSTLSRENFPVKEYGDIVIPEGNYEAYKITLGEGKGKNWWCVMFPPLCFIDVSKGEVERQETNLRMKENLTEEEYKLVKGSENSSSNAKVQNGEKSTAANKNVKTAPKVKFRLWELIKKLFPQ